MSVYRIQGEQERRQGVYYEFDSEQKPLGEGGMGKVFKGVRIDEKSGASSDVAVKFLFANLSPFAIEKARREASIRIKHENLIEMLGFIETETSGFLGEKVLRYHVVSELLNGVSLEKLLRGELRDQEGKVVPKAEELYNRYCQNPYQFAVEIVTSVLSGLICMHNAGYVHRDISSDNIMITREGGIKLIDFGIAKQVGRLTSHDKHLTHDGHFIGKPDYAAPELVLGKVKEQSQATDTYAVGVLLFECITGHRPFTGDSASIMQEQLHHSLPLRQIGHRGLRSIIDRATKKKASRRYVSAASFLADVESYEKIRPQVRIPVLAGGAVAALLMVAGIAYTFYPKPVPPAESDIPQDYVSSLAALHDPNKSMVAIKQLRELTGKGDANAAFLLSRLLFRSKASSDYCPDSIQRMQRLLKLPADNAEALRLLQETVRLDNTHYQAYYELACDYWGAEERTDAVRERNAPKAEEYFNKTKVLAQKANDTLYVNMAQHFLERIRLFKENIKYINSKP